MDKVLDGDSSPNADACSISGNHLANRDFADNRTLSACAEDCECLRCVWPDNGEED